ncbi:MAG: serine/threonine protein kinase [Desulfofustis sp.]|nr:serine/threonine protein kinase [Desulfofustis sp.]
MTKLSENFERHEFACKCGCGQDTVDAELINVLQWLRDVVRREVKISSGNRCPVYNRKVGGAARSKHKIGRAADISVTGMTPGSVFTLIDNEFPDRLGLIQYSTFVHVDTRDGRYRDQR